MRRLWTQTVRVLLMPLDPTGRLVRNAVMLRRTENRVAREIAELFDQAASELAQLVAALDPGQVMRGNVPRRLRALDRRMRRTLDALYRDARALGLDSVVDIAEVQAVFAAQQLERAVGTVGVEIDAKRLGRQFWRSALTEDPVRGAVMSDWWSRQKAQTAFRFTREMRLGMGQQETVGPLIRRVRQNVMGTSRRQAEALVRTAVNHFATRAHEETYRANDDVTQEYEYVATLDSRTSAICRALDGQRFRYGDGPKPPQHFNCRSTIVPVVNWASMGIKAPPAGERAAAGGPVSGNLTYSGWLRQQSSTVQNDILGVGRAKIFRSGRATLSDMVRSDGSTVTLAQLKAAS